MAFIQSTKEQAKDKVKELVQAFKENIEQYKLSTYKEAQVRKEFIDPLFSALGWDVSNEDKRAEQYKEVVNEDAIKISGNTKAPDYSFRIGGTRIFFVEAKKPSVKIKDDIEPAFQLRRYAWNSNIPVSILTDFEEIIVYDCRIKPHLKDNSSVARILIINFENLLQDFDKLWDVFSKEAVLRGSFDRYVESSKGKKGTSEVDNEFLKEIEEWRDNLAKNIASSIAESPPPTTITFLSLKKAASHGAQEETPCPIFSFSPGIESHFVSAPVAIITDFVSYVLFPAVTLKVPPDFEKSPFVKFSSFTSAP